LLPEELRPAAWAELRDHVETGDHSTNDQTTLLLQLATMVPPGERAALIARAIEVQDWDVGLEAEHLTLLGRAGDREQALQLAEAESWPYTRSLFFAHALAGASEEQARGAFLAWERAERALWTEKDTVLRSVWPLPLPPPLVGRFLELARELPF